MNPQVVFLLDKSQTALKDDNLELSELYLKQILKVESNNPHALRLLGVLQIKRRKYTEAKEYLEKSLKFLPKNPYALSNLGILYYELKEYGNALDAYDKALKINPNYEEAWSNKGNVLCELNRYEEALLHHDQAINICPSYAEAWSNKGNVLCELNRYEEAILYLDKAISLCPSFSEAWSNRGNALTGLKRYIEAIECCDKSLFYKADNVEAWSNKGNALHSLKRFDEAIFHQDKALGLRPDYHGAAWNKSISLLTLGDFDKGLPLYENRWNVKKVRQVAGERIQKRPQWTGRESLVGKTILLQDEQGLGDFIQFFRYVKLVCNLGANVILETPQPLVQLMRGQINPSFKFNLTIFSKDQEYPDFDYQCPLLSLPLAFKTNLTSIPRENQYISVNHFTEKIKQWSSRLPPTNKPRVGLVWSGNPSHQNDTNRSLPLSTLITYLPAKFEYISLQKQIRDSDKSTLERSSHILEVSSLIEDFVDTAVLIDQLDLVLSVDTSVAHLSGALGKKTLVLLPYVPDWRWLLDREDSPWYPSVKLLRQEKMDDWDAALKRLDYHIDSMLQQNS